MSPVWSLVLTNSKVFFTHPRSGWLQQPSIVSECTAACTLQLNIWADRFSVEKFVSLTLFICPCYWTIRNVALTGQSYWHLFTQDHKIFSVFFFFINLNFYWNGQHSDSQFRSVLHVILFCLLLMDHLGSSYFIYRPGETIINKMYKKGFFNVKLQPLV